VSHGQNVTVDVMIGSKCHCGRSELGRNVQAAVGATKLAHCSQNLYFLNLGTRPYSIKPFLHKVKLVPAYQHKN
jgi:hypothetical protein